MENLEMREIEAAIEGILFASGEPVAVDRICVAMDMDRSTVELVLEGANHAGFGAYGPQEGDGEAAISRQEQQEKTVEAICGFLLAQLAPAD